MESNNLETFNYLKNKYPNLSVVNYENNTLLFPYGNVPLNNLMLSNLPENIFSMSDKNLYYYLSNKFYIHNEKNYMNYTSKILELIKQNNIDEVSQALIQKFTLEYLLKNELYLNELCLANDYEYRKELNEFTKIINLAYSYNSPGCELIQNICNSYVQQKNNDSSPTQNESKSKSKGKSLSLLKNGIKYYEDSEENNLDVAGFVNIMVIIILIILFGVFIASKIIK